MTPTRFQAALALAACLAFAPAARAGECHYLLMFGSQRVPNDPDFSHTSAVFVRATWPGDGPCTSEPELHYHMISWLPVDGVVRTDASEPERGRDWGLHETLRLAQRNGERISLWGPFPIQQDLYCRALERITVLESGRIWYKANDTLYPSDKVSNCIHAVSGVVGEARVRVGSPGWGDVASYLVLQRLRPWLLEETPQYWVAKALGLGKYPIVYREGFSGPGTSVLARLGIRLFGQRGVPEATYGPPR